MTKYRCVYCNEPATRNHTRHEDNKHEDLCEFHYWMYGHPSTFPFKIYFGRHKLNEHEKQQFVKAIATTDKFHKMYSGYFDEQEEPEPYQYMHPNQAARLNAKDENEPAVWEEEAPEADYTEEFVEEPEEMTLADNSKQRGGNTK